ncbi:hypothetical protein CBP51_15150 [Cellvibrio mixtus]|uniref:TNase-like domain-containing protein n=1 Tax=Cellvibrio mixtus TaxID=39650 RepID=A0A266Q3V2_9GAMM|nr:hypothetical protein CBP51_15150 [Cellvibrio mixtus]
MHKCGNVTWRSCKNRRWRYSYDGTTQYNVRLVEIDAPASDQLYGQRSKKVLTSLIIQENISVNVSGYDRYRRVLGRVYVADLNVNRQMVRVGAAWVYLQYMTDRGLLDDESAAKKEKIGVWSLPAGEQMAPWEWRFIARDR